MTNSQMIEGLKDVAYSMREEKLENTKSFEKLCNRIAELFDYENQPGKARFWKDLPDKAKLNY